MTTTIAFGTIDGTPGLKDIVRFEVAGYSRLVGGCEEAGSSVLREAGD
jgi:hypothetical protein